MGDAKLGLENNPWAKMEKAKTVFFFFCFSLRALERAQLVG